MEHAGESHIGGVRRATSDDVPCLEARQRLADVPVTSVGKERDVLGDRAGERRIGDELAVRDPRGARDHVTFARVQLLDLDAEAAARAREELGPSERRGAAEDRCLLLRGVAAVGAPVVRRQVGVAHHHPHPIDRHVQLVGHDLGESRADALAELDLSGERRDHAIDRDRDAIFEEVGLVGH